jgi:hypothetical protein
MALLADIIEGGMTLGLDGYKVDRVFIVTEATGSADQRMANALATVVAAHPFTTAHPAIASIYPSNYSIEPKDKEHTIFQITVTYDTPTFENQPADDTQTPIVQLGSSVVSSQTQLDKDGNQLVVSITTAGGDSLTQTGEVEIQEPQTIIQFERKEQADPLSKSLAYTGSVNNATFKGWAARTWLCLGIEGISDDGGSTYKVTYRFQYRAATWDAKIAFIDPATDKIHADVTTSNGILTETIYPETNFSALNL